MEFAIIVIMYDRGGEEEIDRVLAYGNRAHAVDSAPELAAQIIRDFEWDNPELEHEISNEGTTWYVDNEPVFALALRPIENRRYNTGK